MLLFELSHPTLRVALVSAGRVQPGPSDATLEAELVRAEQRVRSDPSAFPEPVRVAMRDVLRVGGYKPTGRGKPASELLLAMAQQDGLPRIGNLVDCNNLASLESALPISIFDADALGKPRSIRFGRAGETYVFNVSGHAMGIEGLPVVCRGDEPVGNAVRDSMLGKVGADTRAVFAVIWGSSTLAGSHLQDTAARLAKLLEAHARAEDVSVALRP